jgi:hypothetical protein
MTIKIDDRRFEQELAELKLLESEKGGQVAKQGKKADRAVA